jgi:hypothetical protein
MPDDRPVHCTADEVLALPPGQLTASLARRALRLDTMMGFAELQEKLQEQHDVRVTDMTLDALATRRAGRWRTANGRRGWRIWSSCP